MEGPQFDDFIRALAGSRRSLLGGTLGLASGLIGLSSIDARKKRKRKKPKQASRTPQATPNEFGCLSVNDPCTGPGECCSGICEGKKGKKTCGAHDASTCQAGQNACDDAEATSCVSSTGAGASCDTTTGNAPFCTANGDCFACKKDADCVPFCGANAACIKCAACADKGVTTACVSPDDNGCTFPM